MTEYDEIPNANFIEAAADCRSAYEFRLPEEIQKGILVMNARLKVIDEWEKGGSMSKHQIYTYRKEAQDTLRWLESL